MHRPQTIRRAAGIAAAAALLTSLVGSAPAIAAARPSVSTAAPSAAVGVRRHGTITPRGRVNAASAARAAVGKPRAQAARPSLRMPAPARTPSPAKQPTVASPRVSPHIALTPPAVIDGWFGISTGDVGAADPPDPWIAVNNSFVVESTNGGVVIVDRASRNTQTFLPTWALFGLTPAEGDQDPRIIWDAAHSRWVGVLTSWVDGVSGLDAGYLNIAVSDTADPRGTWNLTSYGFEDDAQLATFPANPGIASSSTTLVVTEDEFDNTVTNHLGAGYLVLKWSDILTSNLDNPVQWPPVDTAYQSMRPAIIQGSTTGEIHMVAESKADGSVHYQRLSTPTTPVTWAVNLTAASGVTAPSANPPAAPRQPGGTIAQAVDTAILDAVWHAGKLAFVTTVDDGGADKVRVTVLDTTTATPALDSDVRFGDGGTTDAYLGGIGWTKSGYLVTVFTQSSDAMNPSIYTAAYSAADKSVSSAAPVQTGLAASSSDAYGRYVGVAIDTTGDDTVWAADQAPDGAGAWQTVIGRYSMDLIAPVVTAPSQTLVAGSTLGLFQLPVKVSWPTVETGSGVKWSYLDVDQFGSGSAGAGIVNGTSTVRSHFWKPSTGTGDYSYGYQVSVVDASDNSSGPVSRPAQTAVVYEQTKAAYGGTWTTKSTSGFTYSGQSVKYSTKVGAYAFLKTTGSSFGFVTTKGSAYGKAKVYVDGKLKTTLNLKSSVTKYRNLAYVISFATSGSHTIKIVVASGRVDVDAFVVLR